MTLGLLVGLVVVQALALVLPWIPWWLAAPSGGAGEAWQVWRVVTHALLTGSLLGLVFSALFLGWLGYMLESEIGSPKFALVALAAATTVAAVVQWVGSPGFVIGASALTWAFIGLWLTRALLGERDTQQLVLLGVLVVANVVMGANIVLLIAGLLAGALCQAVIHFVPTLGPKPGYYDAFRRGSGKKLQARTLQGLGAISACAVIVWLLRYAVHF